MASNQSLFMRILRAITHRVWTVLFFLTLFSVLALANHWWDILAGGYGALAGWIMSAMDAILG